MNAAEIMDMAIEDARKLTRKCGSAFAGPPNASDVLDLAKFLVETKQREDLHDILQDLVTLFSEKQP